MISCLGKGLEATMILPDNFIMHCVCGKSIISVKKTSEFNADRLRVNYIRKHVLSGVAISYPFAWFIRTGQEVQKIPLDFFFLRSDVTDIHRFPTVYMAVAKSVAIRAILSNSGKMFLVFPNIKYNCAALFLSQLY